MSYIPRAVRAATPACHVASGSATAPRRPSRLRVGTGHCGADTPENPHARLGPGQLAGGTLIPTRCPQGQRPPRAVASSCPGSSAASAVSSAIARAGAAGRQGLPTASESSPVPDSPSLVGVGPWCSVRAPSLGSDKPFGNYDSYSSSRLIYFSPRGRCPRRNPVTPSLLHGPGQTLGAVWATRGNTARGQLGAGWQLPDWGCQGSRSAPSFLVHCQETLMKEASKDWEHMFIL